MGFYVRKSVKAGPFRFNVSKSGLGVSVGVPGFRIGTGPRGNYVSMGRGGLYYRTTLARPKGRRTTHPQLRGYAALPPAPAHHPSQVVLEDVTGAAAISLAPTGRGDIVEQLNAAASRRSTAKPVAISVFIVGALLFPHGGFLLWLLAIPLCWWLALKDKARRTVAVLYDVNDAPAQWFQGVVDAWGQVMGSEKVWRTVGSGDIRTVYQHKTNAGAGVLVRRERATANLEGPEHLSTNVAVPAIVSAASGMYFLPDRILIRDGKTFSDVGYGAITISSRATRFIESPGMQPRDARQVGQTWQYVNVKGGPDRRFKNNPLLPIMVYGEVEITSAQGLRWFIQTSLPTASTAIGEALERAPGTPTQT